MVTFFSFLRDPAVRGRLSAPFAIAGQAYFGALADGHVHAAMVRGKRPMAFCFTNLDTGSQQNWDRPLPRTGAGPFVY